MDTLTLQVQLGMHPVMAMKHRESNTTFWAHSECYSRTLADKLHPIPTKDILERYDFSFHQHVPGTNYMLCFSCSGGLPMEGE